MADFYFAVISLSTLWTELENQATLLFTVCCLSTVIRVYSPTLLFLSTLILHPWGRAPPPHHSWLAGFSGRPLHFSRKRNFSRNLLQNFLTKHLFKRHGLKWFLAKSFIFCSVKCYEWNPSWQLLPNPCGWRLLLPELALIMSVCNPSTRFKGGRPRHCRHREA